MRDATLTRRHFEMIAAAINSLPLEPPLTQQDLRRGIAYHFAAVLKDSNKAFDTTLFVNAALKSDMKRNEKLTKRGLDQVRELAVPATGETGS